LLVGASATCGFLSWSGVPHLLPLCLVFPALWSYAPSRILAWGISAAYFLAASHGLILGGAHFFDLPLIAGLALWLASALPFCFLHGAFWRKDTSWQKTGGYGVVLILLAVPPFGILGWFSPLTAAGVVFPYFGWIGLGATLALMLYFTTFQGRPIALKATIALCGLSVLTWGYPTAPEGWVGLSTFSEKPYVPPSFEQQVERVRNARAGYPKNEPMVLVLPESSIALWSSTTQHWWQRELDPKTQVLAGALQMTPSGTNNLLVEISKENGRILYEQRMPMPLAMWDFGSEGRTPARPFSNPVVEVAGKRIAPLICYEQFLLWPILHSMIHRPDILVAIGNGWWTSGTNIVALQKMIVQSWARLFGTTLVMAFNT
jgi:carbon-nitrogen hydrolase